MASISNIKIGMKLSDTEVFPNDIETLKNMKNHIGANKLYKGIEIIYAL